MRDHARFHSARHRNDFPGWLIDTTDGLTLSVRYNPHQPNTLVIAPLFPRSQTAVLPEHQVMACAQWRPVTADVDAFTAAATVLLDGDDTTPGYRGDRGAGHHPAPRADETG